MKFIQLLIHGSIKIVIIKRSFIVNSFNHTTSVLFIPIVQNQQNPKSPLKVALSKI